MAIFDKPKNTLNLGPFSIFSGHPLSDLLCYYEPQRYEPQGSQSSDYLKQWFKNGEHIHRAVFRKKSLKMSVLYWRVPYIYGPIC